MMTSPLAPKSNSIVKPLFESISLKKSLPFVLGGAFLCFLYAASKRRINDSLHFRLNSALSHLSTSAAYRLGMCYLNGWGVQENKKEAVTFLIKAAGQNHPGALKELETLVEKGDAVVQYELGLYYSQSKTIAGHQQTAFQYFLQAARQNHPGALYELGLCYLNGWGVDKNEKKAVEYFREAIKNKYGVLEALEAFEQSQDGYASVQYVLGLDYLYFGVNERLCNEKAFKYFKKAVDLGHVSATYELGMCCSSPHGDSYERNLQTPFEHFSQAAEKGHPAAHYRMGKKYLTERNYTEAFQCFKKAVEVDKTTWEKYYLKEDVMGGEISASARYELGFCYLGDRGIEKDVDTAVEWLAKAAYQRHAQAIVELRDIAANEGFRGNYNHSGAQYHSGMIYKLLGSEVVGDYWKGVRLFKEAIPYFQAAVFQHHIEAQYELGLCHLEGRGTSESKSQAMHWFQRAADQDHKGAEEKLNLEPDLN